MQNYPVGAKSEIIHLKENAQMTLSYCLLHLWLSLEVL